MEPTDRSASQGLREPGSSEASPLDLPVQFLKGVGTRRAELLAKLGINVTRDLLLNLPKDALDLTQTRSILELQEGVMQTVSGQVVDKDSRVTRTGKTMTAVLLKCAGGFARGVWFNQPYMLHRFQSDDWVLFSGQPKFRDKRWEFSHPRVQWLEGEDPAAHGGILPRYRLTEGLSMEELRRISRAAAEEYADQLPEAWPPALRERLAVPTLSVAVRGLHAPTTLEEFEAGRRRLIVEDLFEFQVGVALRRRYWRSRSRAIALPTTAKIDARIRRLFSFAFTAGQDAAVKEIVADLAREQAMHRLLQADVGAGKTAIAIYAMLVAIANQTQAVLMTPTELLARQHWQTIDSLLADSRVSRRLLTGTISARDRADAVTELASGACQLVVGTQAIIQDDVYFQRLGLVVIDEQHKFGVMQRARFGSDSAVPHTLVMTATPIPRSLCLTQFGDLDLSLINELPPGRQKIQTNRVAGAAIPRMWQFVKSRLEQGRQAYVVCPRIEASTSDERSGGRGVADVFNDLTRGPLSGFRVALLHGQLPNDERTAVMERFRQGELDALVATTVIEVGVDVPNATLMVILDAERFGLSQLHQLRGRVGRGQFQGYCFILSDAGTPEVTRRLSAFESTADGFAVAETDFELRGPGDVLGTRQSGELPLRVADLVRDRELIPPAQFIARQLVDSGELDSAEYAPLKIAVLERFQSLMELPQTG